MAIQYRCPDCGSSHCVRKVRNEGGYPGVDRIKCEDCGQFFYTHLDTATVAP